ncbi:MAG: helix-turn-helix domain-containing protein [Burkholderiaceae bacterium]
MSDNTLLTPAEIAAYLRTSERTIARMVADGCPSIMVGKRRRFDLQAVLTWSKEQAQCQSDKTPVAFGTPKLASAVAEFTDSYRRAALRVMPSA